MERQANYDICVIYVDLYIIGVFRGMVSGIDLGSQMVGLQWNAVKYTRADMLLKQPVIWYGRNAVSMGHQPAVLFSVLQNPWQGKNRAGNCRDSGFYGRCIIQCDYAPPWRRNHILNGQ